MLGTWFSEHPYCIDSDILLFLLTNVHSASAKCPECKCFTGWIVCHDGQMNGMKDGWLDGWIDGCDAMMDGLING